VSYVDLRLTRSSSLGDAAGVRLGEPLLDAYLEFRGGAGAGRTRCWLWRST
jgi:hypothetical protein